MRKSRDQVYSMFSMGYINTVVKYWKFTRTRVWPLSSQMHC